MNELRIYKSLVPSYDLKPEKSLKCFIDGMALCVVKKNFIDLQESDAVFIDLTHKQVKEIEDMIDKD